ncbi:MAG: thioredoxin domain-containing protein [Candidatus Brocadiaceae bacterium]|nr:thioredoxin domain-containing protein [Candidatus Brocadiaceae bacterium]
MSAGDQWRDAAGGNRLAESASPYLRQHSTQPVDWYPWGAEALERARTEDKPILLSIGYSACHWCHAMARECFENPAIAAAMNAHFVCVKVDREERPDLDALYMRALQLMTGLGGWPLTVFLTPDGVPFFGGTYFPPEDRAGLPGFPQVLEAVRSTYADRRDGVHQSAARILDALRSASIPEPAGEPLSADLWEPVLRACAARFDMEYGGFGTGSKFPQAPLLHFLLRYWGHTGDQRCHLMALSTLDRMSSGSLFDQIGGGFHRYTVDREWRVPHFEKMLCDSAQLVGLYADAHRATGRPGCLPTAVATAEYMLRELCGADGGFFASQDADTDGREGAFYLWTYGQILDCLGRDDGRIVARYFGVDRGGAGETAGSVLSRTLTVNCIAGLFRIGSAEADAVIRSGARRLFEERSRRTPLAVDHKVLTDWNALAVSGLTRLYRATGQPRYLQAARQCVELLLSAGGPDGRLVHVLPAGRADGPAFLTDYAFTCGALLDLYGATFEVEHIRSARALADTMVRQYWDSGHGLFAETGRGNEPLIAALHDLGGGPAPSGHAAACHALLRLSALEDCRQYADVAARGLTTCRPLIEANPEGAPGLLSATLRLLAPPRELVIAGTDCPGGQGLLSRAREAYVPDLTLAGARADEAAELAETLPLLASRRPVGGRAAAYLCSDGVCRAPVQDADALGRQLAGLRSGKL